MNNSNIYELVFIYILILIEEQIILDTISIPKKDAYSINTTAPILINKIVKK